MKPRSPVLGYNHNVRYAGRLWHVQTEDSGAQNPHLFTHLFHDGTILATKRLDYDPTSDVGVVQKLMQAQHKAMLRDLKQGAFDDKIARFFGAPVIRELAKEEGTDPGRPASLAEFEGEPKTDPSIPDAGVHPSASAGSHLPTPAGARPGSQSHVPRPGSQSHVPRPGSQSQVARPGSQPVARPGSQPLVARPGSQPLTRPGSQPLIRPGSQPLIRPGSQPHVVAPGSRPVVARPAATAPPNLTPSRPAVPVSASHSGAPPTAARPAVSGVGGRRPGTGAHAYGGGKPTAEGVVVARPAVIVGDPQGTAPRASASSTAVPRQGAAATPPAKTPTSDNIFGGDLISEKSLDEVILAYLSEDLNDK